MGSGLFFPVPNPHKAKGRLTPYNFLLETAYPLVLLLDPKVASYLSDLWHASNPLLRLHSKTLSKTPIYSSIFVYTHIHKISKLPNSPFFDVPLPHDLTSVPQPGIWDPTPLDTNLLSTLRVIQSLPGKFVISFGLPARFPNPLILCIPLPFA